MPRHKKAVIFIGSSKEGLDIARTVEELLFEDARVQLWTAGTFKSGTYPLEELLLELGKCDYAAFVLSPDDINIDININVSRKEERPSPRDNVIFEAGLFMGRLGRLRTFLIYDKEHDVKLPSDLKGLTLVQYSHHRYLENPRAALGPAATQIRGALGQRARFEELEFLKAYLRFIDPQVSLTDTYCRMLNKNLDQIRGDVAALEVNGDWETLVEIKVRLREYFEYSGMYRYGAECGKRFAHALKELGDDHEAAWTNVKQVAYLKILSGDHKEGRDELFGTLRALQSEGGPDSSKATLRFYCNRYLGISVQREELPGNLEGARKYFDEAQKCIEALDTADPVRSELQGRLWANYGNLALEAHKVEDALKSYTASLKLFIEVNDAEHIGIANLKIGEAIVAGAGDLGSAKAHLDRADGIFLELGHLELQGRVAEQRALLNEELAKRALAEESKRRYADIALENANRAKRLYRQIDSQKRLGAIEAILQSLRRGFPDIITQAASDAQN